MYYMPSSEQVLANHSDIRAALPNVMFFSEMDDATLAAHGIFPLHIDEFTGDCTKVFAAALPELREGSWWRSWDIRDATPDETVAAQRIAIDSLVKLAVERLNVFAATRLYGDEQTSPIVAACSYAASTHERYGSEGRYCVAVRDQTWDVLNQMRDDVMAGRRRLPADFDAFEPELPKLIWPD